MSIVVEDYHKAYGKTVAVAGLSFVVEPGEILGLVGPNGAGKTTTLRALAGILEPTRGRLLIAGHDLARTPVAAKAALAFVPDEPRLFDHLTIWEHLRFMAAVYNVKDWLAPANTLLQLFELEEKQHALTAELSRGMRQKVAICCAYLHRPKAILFDEPLTGLDPRGIRTIRQSIREQAAEGAAVIISSHLLSLVEDLCTSVLIMFQGRQLLRGKLSELRQQISDSGQAETLEELFFRLTEGAERKPAEDVVVVPPPEGPPSAG